MINPTIFLKKANEIAPTKYNKKGFRPRHSITLDDNGELCLTIVVNYEKQKFHRMKIDNNTNIDTLLTRNKEEILKLMKKFPVK